MKRQVLRSRVYLDAGFPLFVMEVEQKAMPSHTHDFHEMVYVRRGRGTHLIENVPYPIRTGDVYFLRPGEAHAYLPDCQSLHIINVLWQPSLVKEVLRVDGPLTGIEQLLQPRRKSTAHFERRLHLTGNAAFRVENLLDEMRREIEAAKIGAPAPGSNALLRHLFCALLVLLSRAASPEAKPNTQSVNSAAQTTVAQAIAYLEEHFTESVRVDDVASLVALSPGRFAHLFKAQTGRSVIEYLHELRMEKVCTALRESNLAVQEIAREAGYNDARFFHRIFRRHTGCSPKEYRARLLES